MSKHHPTLNSLAATISQAAKDITKYLEKNDFAQPSFAESGPYNYPKSGDIAEPRFQLLEALQDMYHLAMGPSYMAFAQPALNNHDGMVLDVMNQFDFFSAVPLEGSASYGEISHQIGLPEAIVRRILRHAFTMRLFAEESSGSSRVIHTATTAYLSKNQPARSWLAHNLEEVRPGTIQVPRSLQLYSVGKGSASEEVAESGFSLADIDRTGLPTVYWDYLKNTPPGLPPNFRANRFSEAMASAAKSSSSAPSQVLQSGFDWASLGKATVVEVGGSQGHDAISLAQNYPNLQIVVQDLPEVEPAFQTNLPKDLRKRVTFMRHNFFTPQKLSADVFLLKMILHDWPDKYAVRILQCLVPCLRAGDRVVLCEAVTPPTHDSQGKAMLPHIVQRVMSSSDLQMLTVFNSSERSQQDWEKLIKAADERFSLQNIKSFPGAIWSVLEVIFEG